MSGGRTAADYTLLVALFGSVGVGLGVVTSDAYLWAVAPAHAYGLIAFVGIDAALITGLLRGSSHVGILTVVLAAVQLLAMGGDLAGLSLPSGISASGFTSYLLGDVSFVVLLVLQPAVAYLGGMALAEERIGRVAASGTISTK